VTHDDTPSNGIYFYVVRAFYLNWESADSDEVPASTDTCTPPSVGGLVPASGPKTGGTSVVISGSGFTGATAVDFGATPATGFVVDSDGQITATAPAGVSVVDVAVSTPFGTNADTAADNYTYNPVTYYVRTDGSDANTGLSNTAGGAWLTIQTAADTMTAGDTVLVQPGTYPETVAPLNAGTGSQPITYQAEGLVVVDGGNSRCKAFNISGTGYLVIDGFEITDQPDCDGSDAAVDVNNANNVTIRNNTIHDTGRDAIYFKGTSANGLVENNLIYNIDDDGSTPIGGGNHIFRNNTFAGTIGGWTLEDGLATNLFENNIFWAASIENTGLGTFNYNDYNGAALTGTGNISSDPLFIGGYYLSHIAAGQGTDSPAIDAGSDAATNLGLDTKTTRTDTATDTGTVDLGYHYDPALAPPFVGGLVPASGPKTGGTSVVISGAGFTGASAVDFGASPATGFVVDSDTQITATAPAGVLEVDVRVATPSGTSANTAADNYAYNPATYYVRTDGSDANTGLTNSTGGAWLTIQTAADAMTAGDTVRVQPGTYPEAVAPLNAGTGAQPITYLAEGLVVIDGGNTRCKAFDIVGTGYLVIDGFEITDQPDCGGVDSAVDVNNASNVTIRNNIIHDTGRDAIYFKGTSANGLVENNLIYNIDDDGSEPSGGGNHIFRNNTFAGTIGGWTLEDGSASNLFENNIFWVTSGNGAIQNTGLGTFNYNDYNGAVLAGTGNISSDPLFVSGYHLSHIAAGQGSNSPAIDAGSDTATNLGLDTKTTRTDTATDTSTVDLGYHYAV
jgi:parallel beta-helix repeat protein